MLGNRISNNLLKMENCILKKQRAAISASVLVKLIWKLTFIFFPLLPLARRFHLLIHLPVLFFPADDCVKFFLPALLFLLPKLGKNVKDFEIQYQTLHYLLLNVALSATKNQQRKISALP